MFEELIGKQVKVIWSEPDVGEDKDREAWGKGELLQEFSDQIKIRLRSDEIILIKKENLIVLKEIRGGGHGN